MRYQFYSDDNCLMDTRASSPKLRIYDPQVTLEDSKAGSFVFTIYPEHPYFDRLRKMKSIIKIYRNGSVLFRGRILNSYEGMRCQQTCTCEGELAFLNDSILRPYDWESEDKHTTIRDFFTYIITQHNGYVEADRRFEVGNITVVDNNNYIVVSSTAYETSWATIQKKLLDRYGGHIVVRHEGDVSYIDYLADIDILSEQGVKFGLNLLDFGKSIKGDEIATAVIPLGAKIKITDEDGNETETDNRLTIADVNGGLDYVYDAEAVAKYGYIFTTITYDDVTEASNLLRKGESELARRVLLSNSITVTAVDLSAAGYDIDSFEVSTYVPVESAPHNIDARYLIRKLVIYPLKPSNNKLTLEATYSSLTEKVAQQRREADEYITTIERKYNNVELGVIQQIKDVYSYVDQQPDVIVSKVGESFYSKEDVDKKLGEHSSELKQTKDGWEMNFTDLRTYLESVDGDVKLKFEDLSKWIRFIDGNIEIGEISSSVTLKLENDVIAFYNNNSRVAYFADRKLYIQDGEFLKELRIGDWAFVPGVNKNLSFKKVVA